MIRSSYLAVFAFALIFLSAAATDTGPDWGFFGHRRINRLATFTLPPEMMPLFRAQIDYLSEHAVDPDKRRYASEGEAVRHYIDLDHWGRPPFDDLPRRYADALASRGSLLIANARGDTTRWNPDTLLASANTLLLRSAAHTIDVPYDEYRRLWFIRSADSLQAKALELGIPIEDGVVTLHDEFTQHGILPYHLQAHHRRLTEAFVARDVPRILQLAAEMGHYVGDAHVPLHTTENYNGQLTGQTGIHAFWESRLPELFADEAYDYFVGPAEYIADPETYYWGIVMDSHALVDSVLNTERRLREEFPADRQQCFEERLGRQVSVPCSEFSLAWSQEMNGMVEARFRAAIRAVGSAWYSCWVDAGQPDLDLTAAGQAMTAADSLPSVPTSTLARPHE